jgi:hypothetical protein
MGSGGRLVEAYRNADEPRQRQQDARRAVTLVAFLVKPSATYTLHGRERVARRADLRRMPTPIA